MPRPHADRTLDIMRWEGQLATALAAQINNVKREELPRLDVGRAAGIRNQETWERCLLVMDGLLEADERNAALVELVRGRYDWVSAVLFTNPDGASPDQLGATQAAVGSICDFQDLYIAEIRDVVVGRVGRLRRILDGIGRGMEPGIVDVYLPWQLGAMTLVAPKATPWYRTALERALTWDQDVPMVVRTPFLHLSSEQVSSFVREEVIPSRGRDD